MKKIFYVIALLAILFSVAGCAGNAPEEPVTISYGTIVDLIYVPEQSGSGISFGITGDGVVPIIGGDSGNSEEWMLVIDVGGKIETVEVEPEVYYLFSVGDGVEITFKHQGIYRSATYKKVEN